VSDDIYGCECWWGSESQFEKSTVEFQDVEAIHETDMALLCQIAGDEVWVPKSQIADESEVWSEGGHGTLVVTEWWVQQRGL